MNFSPGQKVRHKNNGRIMVCERYQMCNSNIYLLKQTPFFLRPIYSQSQKLTKQIGWVECKWIDENNIIQRASFQEHELELVE